MITIPVAILCGGKGTRLGALTETTPKALVRVAGRPFIEWQLDILQRQGAKNVVLCVGHLADQISKHVMGHPRAGMEIGCWMDYERSGQLAAIRVAVDPLGDEFLILYGDSYLDVDYEPIIEAGRRGNWPAQAVYQGVDYGITYMRREALDWFPAEATMSNLTTCKCEAGATCAIAVEMPNRFYQIGDPAGLAEVEWLLREQDDFANKFLAETEQVAALLDRQQINAMVEHLVMLRKRGGRLFILGNGGSAANASHFVNDARKLCDIDAYTMENVAEITARTNDDGWRNTYAQWLRVSNMGAKDVLMILSVGGGQDVAPAVSVNIAYAVQEANRTGTVVLGVCGRDGGFTARHSTVCLLVPTVSADRVTPHTEAFQSVLTHLLVSHPRLQRQKTKW